MTPVAKLVIFVTTLLGALVALQSTGVLTGGTAAAVTAIVGVLNAALGWLTHRSTNAALRRARGGRP